MRQMHLTLAPLIILFVGTLYSATRYWSRYMDDAQRVEWTRSKCLILRTRVGRKFDRYRSEITVTKYTDHLPEGFAIRAFRYGGGIYNVTQAQAKAFNSQLTPNSTRDCWIRPSDYSRVSLTVVSETIPDSNCVIAIFLTVFCSGIAVMVVTLSLLDACFDEDLFDPPDLENQGPRRKPLRFVLSGEQIRILLDRYGVTKGEEKVDEWSCSICLDSSSSEQSESSDESGEEDRPMRITPSKNRRSLTCLPCSHVFHEDCIQTWLQRGGNSCPLCKFQFKDLFAAVRRLAQEIDFPSSTTVQAQPLRRSLSTPPSTNDRAASLSRATSSSPREETLDDRMRRSPIQQPPGDRVTFSLAPSTVELSPSH